MKLLMFLALSVVLVFGGALVLLHTARKPKIPKLVRPKPYDNKEDQGG